MGRFVVGGIKSSGELLEKSLGALERDVMTLAWEQPEINVRECCERLGSRIAYTTVTTTMDRLFKKGLLARRKDGRAFVYRAVATRQGMEGAGAPELGPRLLP